MKQKLFSIIAIVLAGGILAALPTNIARADAPTVVITAPTAGTTYFTTSFPYNTSIAFNIIHNEVRNLNVLDVQVDGVSILDGGNPIGNPLSGPGNTNACSSGLLLQATTCNVADAANASISIPWTVPAPGTYTITVSLRHNSAEGEGEVEDVTYALTAVEFPAPPAVANNYLNTAYTKSQLSSKKRGCIISQIAARHAQDSYYGPKGGPYDEILIQSDANSFFSNCQ